MNGAAISNGVKMIARPVAVLAAGYCGGGFGAQFGPWAVNAVVNQTATGYLSGFLYKQALNAALGQYYYPVGQLILSSAVAACPSPGAIARAVHTHNHHQSYLNELRKSQFDPKHLEMKEIDEGYIKCSYDIPLDESTYDIVDEEEADSLPKLHMLHSGKCDQYQMTTYSGSKADDSGIMETAV